MTDLLDIYAPGTDIILRAPAGSVLDTSYIYGEGTSFSTPMVAAAVAHLLTVDPNLTVAEAKAILLDTATQVNGINIMNLQEAVKAAEQ